MDSLKFPYARPDLNKSDIKAVIKVLESQYLAQGKIVQKFEKKLKKNLMSQMLSFVIQELQLCTLYTDP